MAEPPMPHRATPVGSAGGMAGNVPKNAPASRARAFSYPSRSWRGSPATSANMPETSISAASAGPRSVTPPRQPSRITESTRSRFSSMSARESAPRLSRSRGSVLDGRTLKCHCA